MRLPPRQKQDPVLPGTRGTLRVRRQAGDLTRQVEPGDIVVLDQRDLDAPAARSLLERRPAAVLNGAGFISGQVPNLGTGLLAEAGIPLIEVDDLAGLRDGRRVRLDGASVYDDETLLVEGRLVTADEVADRAGRARTQVAAHLTSFVHNATELLRREEAVLLHGTGVPTLRTRVSGRPAVVVAPDADPARLKRLRRYLKEQAPVVIAVDDAAMLLAGRRIKVDVLVLSESAGAASVPGPEVAKATDVVVPTSHEGSSAAIDRLGRNSVRVEQFVTATTTYDAALLLARHNGAELIIPVGRRSGLEDLVDGSRSGQASSFVTRMALGPDVVEDSAVPRLYSGRTSPWLLLLLLLVALAAVAVAVASTPVGQEWWDQLRSSLHSWTTDLLPKD